MKKEDIFKLIAKEFGEVTNSSIEKLNLLLKPKESRLIKFHVASKKLKQGQSGPIKNVTPEGIKLMITSRTILVRFEEMISFQRAQPRIKHPKPVAPPPPVKKVLEETSARVGGVAQADSPVPLCKDLEIEWKDEEWDEDDLSDVEAHDFDPVPKKKRRKQRSGSFIPVKNKK